MAHVTKLLSSAASLPGPFKSLVSSVPVVAKVLKVLAPLLLILLF